MENQVIKVDQNYLDEIEEINRRSKEIYGLMGQLEFKLISINNHKKELENQFQLLNNNQNELYKEIEIKYGKGQLNVKTGELTQFDDK